MIKAHCPICDRELTGESRANWPCFPFCSERCRLIDLGRWLGEAYRIAPEPGRTAEAVLEDEEENP